MPPLVSARMEGSPMCSGPEKDMIKVCGTSVGAFRGDFSSVLHWRRLGFAFTRLLRGPNPPHVVGSGGAKAPGQHAPASWGQYLEGKGSALFKLFPPSSDGPVRVAIVLRVRVDDVHMRESWVRVATSRVSNGQPWGFGAGRDAVNLMTWSFAGVPAFRESRMF